MNPAPFTLESKFLPVDALEDKIDLELSGWRVYGIGSHPDDVMGFKKAMASPPSGSEDLAWGMNGMPPLHGSFFARPHMKGKDRSKLFIRRSALIHKIGGKAKRRHEAPLCGGHCLFYSDKSPESVGSNSSHLAKLRLSMNFQRFLRHQPTGDNPTKLVIYRLKSRKEDRSVHGEEQSFDGEDNWIPNTPEWSSFVAKTGHLPAYINLIVSEMEMSLDRGSNAENAWTSPEADSGWGEVLGCQWEREKEIYTLSTVETAWEFASMPAAIGVWEIGAKLMHLKRDWGFARFNDVATKQAARIKDSPCISIPLAENAFLRLYAKTNRRIRFEVVQTGIGKRLGELRKEAGLPQDSMNWDEIPKVLLILRKRAAELMGEVMKELRAGPDCKVPAKTVVHFLAELAAAVPFSDFSTSRFEKIQTLIVLLCFQKGYRGAIKNGPYSPILKRLEERGVLKFQRRRQFYVLSPEYTEAADSLLSVTGEPLWAIFGKSLGEFDISPEGKLVHLRE